MTPAPTMVLSCEHFTNFLPRAYKPLFRRHAALLSTHRGYDPGIAPLARRLARLWGLSLLAFPVSRLLVEVNRSVPRRIFSVCTQDLDPAARETLLAAYYRPYRRELEARVRGALALARPVLHLSLHSFTPHWRGRTRSTDIGLLYDPACPAEQSLVCAWQRCLRQATGWRVHRNRPYRGTSDGVTTWLRRLLGDASYLGLEIEINQSRLQNLNRLGVRRLAAHLVETLSVAECEAGM